MNLPSPRQTTRVYGHQAAKNAFDKALRSGRFPHAWLISGADGIGKTTLAFYFARQLLNALDPQSPAGRRVFAGTHADLLCIGRERDPKKNTLRQEITLEDLKPLSGLTRHTSSAGGWRVVILEDGQYLNHYAANALLKILEEPPQKTVFFLISSSPSSLPATLRSRCRTLKLFPLTDVEMAEFLDKIDLDAQNIGALVETLDGAPGRIFASLKPENAALRAEASRWLDEGVSHLSPDKVSSLAKKENSLPVLFGALQDAIRRRAHARALEHDLTGAENAAKTFLALERLRHETERFYLDKSQAIQQAATIVSKL